MDEYLDYIRRLISEHTYATILLGLFLENAIFLGIVVPGILVLLVAGFYAGEGSLNFAACVAAGVAGTVAGDNFSYFLGKYGARRISYFRELERRNPEASALLHSGKPYLLVFFQFPVYLRVILPAVLGVTGYPFRRWLLIDLIGSTLFNTTFVGLGFVIARTTGLFADASRASSYIQYVFAGVFVLWVLKLLWELRKWKRRRAAGE